jgi:hypothetical protein
MDVLAQDEKVCNKINSFFIKKSLEQCKIKKPASVYDCRLTVEVRGIEPLTF